MFRRTLTANQTKQKVHNGIVLLKLKVVQDALTYGIVAVSAYLAALDVASVAHCRRFGAVDHRLHRLSAPNHPLQSLRRCIFPLF